ncbi:MAG: hypothetical protein QGF94_01105 [Candidatus Thalassarchaeaceae archaeon]|jgi:hypothetical protein|nr:hypothetical protein [Candidatus Thalassarchaeaceae archaeon]
MPLIDTPMDESTPWLIAALNERCHRAGNGLILDSLSANEPLWCCPLSAFEKWYIELEAELNQTLGRRLAHAAAESEEIRWTHAPPLPSSWFKQQSKRMATVNNDWAIRGLGQIGLLESKEDEVSLIVGNRAHTAIAAGMANAVWECIQGQRFRFQWSDRGASETLVDVTMDTRNIPSPSPTESNWTDLANDVFEHDLFFERARHEFDGVWTVEGNRTILLHRDLLLRFEMLTIPYLANISRSSDPRFEWKGIDDVETMVYWDGAAESARKQFLASGDLALIASPEHWIGISHQYLAKQGLGLITDVESIDDYGGVRIKLASVFHPALVVGRLIGCWERAEGRPARAEWTSDTEGCEIILCSRREISTE